VRRRRDFITLLGGGAAWPLAARAQRDRLRRVGVLMGYAENDREGQAFATALRDGLQKLGWAEGRNVRFDFRWSGGDPHISQDLAREFIDLKPDVVVAQGNFAVAALQQTNQSTPIVFTQVSDPMGRGFITSLARPGGKITGFTSFEASMGGKWLEKLKEIAPNITRLAVLFNPSTSPHIAAGFYLQSAEEAGRRSAILVLASPVQSVEGLEQDIGRFAHDPNGGLIVLPDGFTLAHADLTVALAARFKLPAIYAFRSFAARGGLVSYGINPRDQFLGAANYVDRILKGATPAELPAQAPSSFELVINLKTAKALGLDVSAQLQQLADQVIE
jgi:putative ABC transport system substrate-binding protein